MKRVYEEEQLSYTETIDHEEFKSGRKETQNVIIFGVLTLLTVIAASILHVNQPEFILDRFAGISEFDYSLFDTVLYVAYLLGGLVIGVVSDRWKKRKLFLLVGTLGSATFYWLMPTAMSYDLLLTYRFLQGIFTVMVWQTLMTLSIDFSKSGNRGRNMGIYGLFLALAMGLGPALGGIVASYGVFLPYYMSTLLSIFVFIFSSVSVGDPVDLVKRPTLQESLSIVQRQPKLIIPGLFNLIDRLHMGFLLTAIPLFLSLILGLSESLRGFTLAIFALPFILLQYPVGKLSDTYGRYQILIVGSLGYGIVLSLLAYFGAIGFSAFLLMLIVLGIFSGVTAPPSMALVGDSVEQQDTAMGMGFFNFFGNIGMVIGPILFGALVFFYDFFTAFLVAGCLEIFVLLVNIILIKVVVRENLHH